MRDLAVGEAVKKNVPHSYHDLPPKVKVACLILVDVFSATPGFKAAKRMWDVGIRAADFHAMMKEDTLAIPSHVATTVYNYLRDFDIGGKPVEYHSKFDLYQGPHFPRRRKPKEGGKPMR